MFTCVPSSTEQPAALILGLGVHGLAIARSLGRHGVAVDVADRDITQPHGYSKYCRRLYRVPSLEDDRLAEFLVGFGREQPGKTALFLTMDRTVPVIAAHRDLLSERFTFTLPPDDVLRELTDKTRLPAFLARCNALHPKTVWVRHPEDLASAIETTGLPCVVKPALRAYGFKAGIARSAEDLAELYSAASCQTEKVIVQQWIPGGDRDVYFCFVYIGRDSRPKGVFVGRKLRQLPRGTGIAAAAEGCENPFVREESLRLFRLAGYAGFGSTEFRRDPTTDRYYLIEFTVGRTDYNVACAIGAGVDLPFLGYCDMAGLATEPGLPRQRNGRMWVDAYRDVQAILQEASSTGTGILRTASILARTLAPWNVFALFDPRDLRPSVAHVARCAAGVPRAIVKRIPKTIRGTP